MLQLAGLGVLALGGVIVIGMLVDRLFGGPAYGLLRVVRSLNAGDVRARMRRTDGSGVIRRLSRSVNALALRMEEHQHAAAALEDQLRNERAARLVETLPPPPPPTAAARPEGSRTPTYSVEPVLEDPSPTPPTAVPVKEEAQLGVVGTGLRERAETALLVALPARLLTRCSPSVRAARAGAVCAARAGELSCGKTLLTGRCANAPGLGRHEVGCPNGLRRAKPSAARGPRRSSAPTGKFNRAEPQHQPGTT